MQRGPGTRVESHSFQRFEEVQTQAAEGANQGDYRTSDEDRGALERLELHLTTKTKKPERHKAALVFVKGNELRSIRSDYFFKANGMGLPLPAVVGDT